MTQTTDRPTTTPTLPWGAPFAVLGANHAMVLPDAEIRKETVADAQHRALNAQSDEILGVLIPFERDALATTFLGRPSSQPETDAVHDPGSLDATSLVADIRFNEHEAARYMLALDHARRTLTTDPALSKVVLSRIERYTWRGIHPARVLLSRNRDLHRAAYRYQATSAPDMGSVIAGATPELFLRKRGSTVLLHPMAGTVSRALPKVEAEARLRTPKYLEEHALLVDFMTSRLESLSAKVTGDPEPSVVEAGSVWHLGTEIRAEVPASVSVADLVDLLHPSPAVCGVSQTRAREVISELEPERRHYGGLVGWLTPQGDGDLYMALRGLEIESKTGTVTLRAGGGITATSDPLTEFEETADKLEAMRRVLNL